MTPDDLAVLLDEANHAPSESLQAALALADGQPHPRIAALAAHLRSRKRALWQAVADALNLTPPPDEVGLTSLMAWEVAAARALPAEALNMPVAFAGSSETVAALLRLNARQTCAVAGQIVTLTQRERWA